jgi:tRNA(fMet)-specific endonuclease VapC
MRYLLDANAVIALLNDTTTPIARRIRRHAPRDVGVSAVVLHELYYGAFKSRRLEQNVARVDALLFPVVEFDQEDARQAGEIRALLASKGTPIGPYDVLIAGQARARELTLVTHNTTEFQRVPGLTVEDWSEDAVTRRTRPRPRGRTAGRARPARTR